MSIPTQSNYPLLLDTDTTLMGDPKDLAEFTLNEAGGIDSAATSFTVSEVLTGVEVPLVMRFRTGELVFVEAMDAPSRTFSVVTRGYNSTAQSHSDGEIVRAVPASIYFIMLKLANIAVQTELGLSPSSATFTTVAERLANHAHSGGDHGAQIEIANILNHNKTLHDSLNINAATVGGATADQLYGEDVLYIRGYAFDKDVKIGDGCDYFTVPSRYNGKSILSVHVGCYTPPSGGLLTAQVHNLTDAVDICSTLPTIDSGEKSSFTAATQPVVDQANNVLATGDVLRFDVDGANGAKGLDYLITVDMS